MWSNLRGASPGVQALQKECMEPFRTHGFGCVEGSKWAQYEHRQSIETDDIYLARALNFKLEAKGEAVADDNIAHATKQREGTPPVGEGKGWLNGPKLSDALGFLHLQHSPHVVLLCRT